MAVKAILILCSQALFIQSALSQCTSRGPSNRGRGNDGITHDGMGYSRGIAAGPLEFPVNGGSLSVVSSSPISPTGVTVLSETAYEGPVGVIGELPFLGAVALEGAVPTFGAGTVDYGCGSSVAMVSEGFGPEISGATPYGRIGYDGYSRGHMY